MGPTAKRLLLVFTAAVVAVGVAAVADRIVGKLFPNNAEREGLIFPPRSTVHYDTLDFRFTAHTNNLGFRDRDFVAAPSDVDRVIALGDSFTYGWGVSIEESWPKVLEDKLKRRGLKVEIANLGAPAAGPSEYARIAERSIPLLRPKLVLVGVLSGDDLAQSVVETPTAQPGFLQAGLSRLVPNLVTIVRAARIGIRPIGNPADLWKHQWEDLKESLNNQQKSLIHGLEPAIEDALNQGRLNPSLILNAINRPRHYDFAMHADKPESQERIGFMASQLLRIRNQAERYGAKVLVISIPAAIYVSAEKLRLHRDLGYATSAEMLVSELPDKTTQMASAQANLPFVSVTNEVRRENAVAPLYFRVDSHFNARGYRTFAELIDRHVVNSLD